MAASRAEMEAQVLEQVDASKAETLAALQAAQRDARDAKDAQASAATRASELVQQLWTGLCLAVGADASAADLPSSMQLDEDWAAALHMCDSKSRRRDAMLSSLQSERDAMLSVVEHLRGLVAGNAAGVGTPARPRRRHPRFGSPRDVVESPPSSEGDGTPAAKQEMQRLLEQLRKARGELQEQAGLSAGLEVALIGTVEALPKLHEARELAEMRAAELEQVRWRCHLRARNGHVCFLASHHTLDPCVHARSNWPSPWHR